MIWIKNIRIFYSHVPILLWNYDSEHFSHKITLSWDTYYTNLTRKWSLSLSHWNFLISRFFSLFRFLPKVFSLKIWKIKNFNGIGGYMAKGVPLKFFTQFWKNDQELREQARTVSYVARVSRKRNAVLRRNEEIVRIEEAVHGRHGWWER